MSDAYIHYVKRRVVSRYPKDVASPWFSELQAYDNAFERPVQHVTRSFSWPATDIRTGDIIWLVSQLFSPWGALPVSIDARIEVKAVEEKDDHNGKTKLHYIAGSNSQWLMLYDASTTLAAIETVSKDGDISSLCDASATNIGQVFQSVRKIHRSDELEALASKLADKPYHFISYRILDGTKSAFRKANQLMNDGEAVFWDRWSLPRRLAERRELIDDASLDKLLNTKISNSTVVWGIESPKYNALDSYSAKEKALAVSLGKYRPKRFT